MHRQAGWSATLVAVMTLVGCAATGQLSSPATTTPPPPVATVAGDSAPASPTADVHDPHRTDTLAAVQAMLASVTLPPAAHQVRNSPTAAVDEIIGPGSPNLIDAVRWWTVPEDRGQMLKFLSDHPPTHTRASGSNNLASVDTLMFTVTAANPAFAWPEVDLSVSDLPDGGSAIRVDAKAIWIPTRTQAGTISTQLTSVDVTLHYNGKTLRRTVSGRAAAAVAEAVNRLQPTAPVEVAGGPMSGDTGFTDELLFHGDGPDVAVTLTVDGPFAGALVQVKGKPQLLLAGYGTTGPPPSTLDAAIIAALGLPKGYRK